MNRKELLEYAIENDGQYSRMDIMLEDMMEMGLIRTLMKLRRADNTYESTLSLVNTVVDEVAKAQLILDRIRIMYGGSEKNENEKLCEIAEHLGVAYTPKIKEEL